MVGLLSTSEMQRHCGGFVVARLGLVCELCVYSLHVFYHHPSTRMLKSWRSLRLTALVKPHATRGGTPCLTLLCQKVISNSSGGQRLSVLMGHMPGHAWSIAEVTSKFILANNEYIKWLQAFSGMHHLGSLAPGICWLQAANITHSVSVTVADQQSLSCWKVMTLERQSPSKRFWPNHWFDKSWHKSSYREKSKTIYKLCFKPLSFRNGKKLQCFLLQCT